MVIMKKCCDSLSVKSKITSLYFVYMLECKDGSIYTGITTDIDRRFSEHLRGVGSIFTKSRKAKKIIYTEKLKGRSAALKREVAIKKLKRNEKLSLAGL